MRSESVTHKSLQSVSYKLIFLGSLLCGNFIVVGCGSKPSLPGAHLAGTVTVDGQPVQKGSITFMPSGETRGQAVGAHIVDSHYDCPYVPLGDFTMRINAARRSGSGKMVEAMGSKLPEMEDIILVKEDIAIKIKVTEDKLDQDFKLRSMKAK